MEDTATKFDDVERRKTVGDMIAAGACDSEYGVQMLMPDYPDQVLNWGWAGAFGLRLDRV